MAVSTWRTRRRGSGTSPSFASQGFVQNGKRLLNPPNPKPSPLPAAGRGGGGARVRIGSPSKPVPGVASCWGKREPLRRTASSSIQRRALASAKNRAVRSMPVWAGAWATWRRATWRWESCERGTQGARPGSRGGDMRRAARARPGGRSERGLGAPRRPATSLPDRAACSRRRPLSLW